MLLPIVYERGLLSCFATRTTTGQTEKKNNTETSQVFNHHEDKDSPPLLVTTIAFYPPGVCTFYCWPLTDTAVVFVKIG